MLIGICPHLLSDNNKEDHFVPSVNTSVHSVVNIVIE